MTFGTTQANTFLDSMLDGSYISLHTGDPGSTGANEVVGGSYVRTVATWDAAASKSKPTNAVCDFVNMPSATITHAGSWSAASGGTFKIGGVLTAPAVVSLGATLRFSAILSER